jgi:hypothetical protein
MDVKLQEFTNSYKAKTGDGIKNERVGALNMITPPA